MTAKEFFVALGFIVLLLIAGIWIPLELWENSTYGIIFLWILGVIFCVFYIASRHAEKNKSKSWPEERSAFGTFLMIVSGWTIFATVIAFKTWPIQAFCIFLIALFLFKEGRRLQKGWKLFLSVRK